MLDANVQTYRASGCRLDVRTEPDGTASLIRYDTSGNKSPPVPFLSRVAVDRYVTALIEWDQQ